MGERPGNAAQGATSRTGPTPGPRPDTYLRAAHDRFATEYNYQRHFAHDRREDGKHTPATVLGRVHGVWCDERELDHPFPRPPCSS